MVGEWAGRFSFRTAKVFRVLEAGNERRPQRDLEAHQESGDQGCGPSPPLEARGAASPDAPNRLARAGLLTRPNHGKEDPGTPRVEGIRVAFSPNSTAGGRLQTRVRASSAYVEMHRHHWEMAIKNCGRRQKTPKISVEM